MTKTNLCRRYLAVFCGFLAAAVLLTMPLGCQRPTKATANGGLKPIPVKVAKAETGSLDEVVRIPVTLNPAKESLLAFKAGGRISRVFVELGDQVKAGTILASLDATDLDNQVKAARAALAVAEAAYANIKAGSRPETIGISRAQLQQAEANLATQKSNYERMKSLYDEKLVSQQQYEAAYAGYQAALAQVKVAQESLAMAETGPSAENLRAAEAQVQQARVAKEIAESQRENLYIIAPFSGYITMAKANVGEMASPGMPLIGLADLSRFHASAYVGQDLAYKLREGMTVRINVQVGAEMATLTGQIIALGQAVDQTLRTYQVKILCSRGKTALKGGMVGEATVKIRESRTSNPIIPRDAVLEENGRPFVYVVSKNRAVRREVKLGVDDGRRVEITAGLKPGEQLVISGQLRLADGAPVEVK